MNQPQVHVSHLSPEPCSWLPPHPTSLGCLRALGWAPCVACKFPLLSILHTVMHMFPYHSVHLSHPLLPPLFPQVCSLCLHLHCCPANRFISTIFLDSTVFLFVTCFTLYNRLWGILLSYKTNTFESFWMKWMNDVLSFNTILCSKILYGTYTKKIDWSFFWNSHVTVVLLLVYAKV